MNDLEYVPVYVTTREVVLDGRALLGLPDDAPGSVAAARFQPGQVLPATTRADALNAWQAAGLVLRVDVPVPVELPPSKEAHTT